MTHQVGIYLYDEVEVLDFAGPFEVFCTAGRMAQRAFPHQPSPFNVFFVAAENRQMRARGGVWVEPHFSFSDHPPIDLLLIPGGVVTAQLKKQAVIDWLYNTAHKAGLTASVCTGAFLLAKTGLLDGLPATTHWEDIPDLRAMFPQVLVKEDVRWVDNGTILSAAGISAGLDMSLHLVEKLEGKALALKTARQMDYAWQDQPQKEENHAD
jgi:transcriptional regulator GlxA family with amidase domain